ncbi:sulfur oxidation c-type cytochrome SoxA [Thiomicrospira microaerophila]|uniref:sulfur oxidation c-type cytochrome SoxA n=1 Tax=Thiomicrospira microaerophila TaxID=406020 RepID=UPI00200F0208|nr:sulfur oxidation c-type cytochrome SoxA [Thiomicrospira microaerophila]UQB41832.1 sulfur oxidation c-type cytochrome SoxA [Thiomicrospira microaerophila]
MKKTLSSAIALAIATGLGTTAVAADYNAHAEKSRTDLIDYFKAKHPNRPIDDYIHGIYGYDADRKLQWAAEEEFPQYLEFVERGEKLFNDDKNAYMGCLVGSDQGINKIRPSYPYFNEDLQKVVTLEGDINRCRKEAGLKEFGWKRGNIAHLGAYLGYEARGEIINVQINSEGAAKAFAHGEREFIEPRGQLGLSCASCHVYNASARARSDILSPALGQVTHFPVWRGKWARASGDGLGTLQRRYEGCHKNMRHEAYKVQQEEYNNMEFFHTYISNGLEINAPSYRQ